MNTRSIIPALLGALTVGCLTTQVNAAFVMLNADVASNAAYDDGWQTGDNGGTGLGAWTLFGGTNSGQFIGNSTLNGDGSSGNINTGGESFGMYGNSGQIASAIRTFTSGGEIGSAILGNQQVFKLKMDNGYIDNGQSVGFGLQNSSGTNRFEFYFQGGDSFYTVNIGGTEYSTGIGFTDDGLDISFKQNADNGYVLNVNGNQFTQANFQALAASDISQFRLFNGNAGSGSSNDAFFNSFQVVPEPSRALLLLLGFCSFALRRRR